MYLEKSHNIYFNIILNVCFILEKMLLLKKDTFCFPQKLQERNFKLKYNLNISNLKHFRVLLLYTDILISIS